MKSIAELKKHLSFSQLAEINDTVKHYGKILRDINTDNNSRYTLIDYKKKFVGVRMQHGEVISISISDYIGNFPDNLI